MIVKKKKTKQKRGEESQGVEIKICVSSPWGCVHFSEFFRKPLQFHLAFPGP